MNGLVVYQNGQMYVRDANGNLSPFRIQVSGGGRGRPGKDGQGMFTPVYGSFRNQAGQALNNNGETDLVWNGVEKQNVTHTDGTAEITVTQSGVYEVLVAYGYQITYVEA